MAARITPPPPEPRSSPRLRLVGEPAPQGLSELDLYALGITRVDLSDPDAFGLVRERMARG